MLDPCTEPRYPSPLAPEGAPLANAAERFAQSSVRVAARVLLRRPVAAEIDVQALRRILVVRVDDRVGNVLLTTPLLRALREGLPHVRIDWLIAKRRARLVEGLFLADELIPYDKRRATMSGPALMWKLRQAHYDAVIEAAHYDVFSTTQALFARSTGAPIRIGSARGESERFYTHSVEIPADLRYDVAARLKLLEPLGLPIRGHELETSAGLGEEHRNAADALLAGHRLEAGKYVIVNPGARKLDRRFPAEKLGAMVRKIAVAAGMKALVVWGPGEEELAAQVVGEAGQSAVLAPATDLDLLAALLRRAALLVTNDTGPMHLGVACGTPTLALFTQADAARWGHPLPTFRAVPAGDDAPDPAVAAERAALELLGKSGN